jgi:colicin import membrane protein
MALRHEGSVSTSLEELMRLEDDRLHREAEAKRRREEEAAAKIRAAELRAREEEDARRDRAHREAEERAMRAREEEARLQAMRDATIAAARAAAETKVRLDDAERRQRLESEVLKAPERTMASGFVTAMLGAGASLVVGLALYFTVLAPQTAHAETVSRAALADRDALRKELTDTAIAQRVKLEAMASELSSEKAARAKAESDLDALSRSTRRGTSPVTAVPRHVAAPAAPAKPCKPGDPLCETIGK